MSDEKDYLELAKMYFRNAIGALQEDEIQSYAAKAAAAALIALAEQGQAQEQPAPAQEHKPCPWCKKTDRLEVDNYSKFVWCARCHIYGPDGEDETEAAAWAAWDKRQE